MSLIKKINMDLKQAMLSKDKLKLESLRAIKTSLTLNQTSVSSQKLLSKEELKKFNYSFQNSIKRINEMDKQPAYKRLGYNIDQNIENEKKSTLTIDKDIDDEVQLRSNNSFLHDNVD